MRLTRVLRETGVVLVAGLLFGSAALAQSSSSVIIGTVVNADPSANKAPIADVVVTATSPNLQGEQTVVTDNNGQYRIPQLPPGVYTLRFDSQGFKPFARSDIQLRLNRTIRVNVELLPEAFTEEIAVTGAPPTIDVGSTTTGVNVDQEFIRRIAVNRPSGKGGAARSFESLAELAPGAQNDTYGVSINGATSPENGYVVDGISTGDPAYGVNASPLSVEFVQDVNVITGGYLPEFGRSTGGVITAVTRSGSNEFHGSVFGNLTPGAFEGNRTRVISQGSVVSGQNALKNLGDFGATLGGPILKDKLWFFAGIAPSFTRFEHTRSFNAFVVEGGKRVTDERGFFKTTPIDGTDQTYFADSRSMQYMGKLTYLINEDHNLSVSVLGTPSSTGGQGRLTIDSQTGGIITRMPSSPAFYTSLTEKANTLSVGAKYSGSFLEKKLLADASVGLFHQVASSLPADGSEIGTTEGIAGTYRVRFTQPRSMTDFETVPNAEENCGTGAEAVLRCRITTYDVGGPGFINDSSLDRYQANAKLTYLLNLAGQHVLKAGVDAEFLQYNQDKAYTGGNFLQESNISGLVYNGQVLPKGTFGFIDARRYGYQTGPDSITPELIQSAQTKGNTIGGFLQDSWSIANRVTVNVGLRYDVQRLYGGDGSLALVMGNQWSPRLGAIVDPLGNGHMKLFANLARYYEQVPLDMADRAFPGERRFYALRVAAKNGNPGCDPLQRPSESGCEDPRYIAQLPGEELSASRLYSGGKTDPEPVDPDIKPQGSDELVVGGEYELMANMRFGASYTYRTMTNVIEDMSRDDGNTYFIGNPGGGFAKDFPEAQRDYNAVTLYLNRTFADGWLAQASYTWSRLYGNYPGLFRPETAQLDPNITSDFDLIDLLENRTGLLPGDQTHSVKLFGAKEFAFTNELSGSLGVSYRGNSGRPINYLGAHPTYLANEVFVLPRGSGGRTPWVNNIDSNIGLNYRVSKDNVVSFTLDVFNLFNFQTVTSVDEAFTAQNVFPLKGGKPSDLQVPEGEELPVELNNAAGGHLVNNSSDLNPNFKQPTQYQSPRQIRLGLRYTF